jgi:NAD(P)-dependent dehydrogenase (short-subunit alcohol dehydrogenase family)
MKGFNGKTVVVTGAASGMGRALAVQLVALGAKVMATDINATGLATLADECAATGLLSTQILDVTDRQAFAALLRQVAAAGSLDYLFNNAGIAITGELKDNTEQDWQRTIDINQMGVLYGTLTAYELMRAQGHGHIVNTASVAGLMPAPMLAIYAMTKHAVVGLSLSLREEARTYGVRVSVVCPGIVETPIVGRDQMQRLNLGDISPYDLIRQKSLIRPITPDQAALAILRGVERNLPEIIFPLHGKLAVSTFHNARRLWELSVKPGLKLFQGR